MKRFINFKKSAWSMTLLAIACSQSTPATVPPKTLANANAKATAVPTSGAEAKKPVKPIDVRPKLAPGPTVPALATSDALRLLKEQCANCHGTDLPENTNHRSFWPMPSEFSLPMSAPDKPNDFERLLADKSQVRLIMSRLEIDQFMPDSYQAVYNKAYEVANSQPTGMPKNVDLTVDLKLQLKSLVAWMELNFPLAVNDAAIKYHGSKSSSGFASLNLAFKCERPATFRTYLNRVTQDALGRPPKIEELKLVSDPDALVTQAHRDLVRQKLQTDWAIEFRAFGVRKFADKVSGADAVRSATKMLPDMATRNDVASEFYQRVLYAMDLGESYKDIILSDKVMVSPNTAKLYAGCTAPVSGWKACDMAAPRGSLFTTVSFLISKPSSFLSENNSYGRVAAMNEVILGETLTPNTEGKRGTIDELPKCLKTEDFRAIKKDTNYAPRGAAKIPASGNLCQTCHINRQLAAGSIVFRSFGPSGDIYTSERLKAIAASPVVEAEGENHRLRAAIDTSITPEWVNKKTEDGPDTPVTVDFLASLLNIGNAEGQEAGCVPGTAARPETKITSVKALAEYYTGDGRVLVKGLSKALPRGISNLSTTNLDVINSIQSAWQEGDGRLEPIFLNYFTTETYTCDIRE